MKDKYIIWIPFYGLIYGLIQVFKYGDEATFDERPSKIGFHLSAFWQALCVAVLLFYFIEKIF